MVEIWFQNMRVEDCKKLFQQAFGIDIQYTNEGLEEIDQLINELYPLGHEPQEALVRLFGFYFGETIVRTIPSAHWDMDNIKSFNEILQATITYKEGNRINQIQPFQRVIRYWFDRSLTLSSLYRYINLTDLELEQSGNLPLNETKRYFNGDEVRVVKEK